MNLGLTVQSNPSLIRDLEFRLRTEDLYCWIEEQAQRLAGLGRVKHEAVEFTPALRADRKIVRIVRRFALKTLGCIIPVSKGYEILFRPVQSLRDQRFTIAHEVAHTFWYSPCGGGKPLSPRQQQIGPDPCIEALCSRLAAAILLPRPDIQRCTHVDNVSPGGSVFPPHMVPLLADRYQVPERLVARRYAHDMLETELALFCVARNSSILAVNKTSSSRSQDFIAWSALPPSLSTRVRKAERIRIPPEMIPSLDEGQTRAVKLDGRWWTLLSQRQASTVKRNPLHLTPHLPPGAGVASRRNDRVYIAFMPDGSAGMGNPLSDYSL